MSTMAREADGVTRLSGRQQQVLHYVREHVRDQGFPPTRSEIAKALGLAHVSSVNYHLNALMRKGWVEVRPDIRRGIRLLRTELPAIATGPVPAGEPLLAEHRIVRRIHEDVAGCFSTPPDYFMIVDGDSMDRVGLRDNDLAAIRAAPIAEARQVVVARVADEVTLRRYEPVDERFIDLVPDNTNEDYRPMRVDVSRTRFAIDGVVVGAMIGIA